MKLDQRFCLSFVTEMTWKTEPFDGEARGRCGVTGEHGGAMGFRGNGVWKADVDAVCSWA